MTKVLWASFVQLFDDYGDPLNGGFIQSYIGNTSTPKATYTDSGGLSSNTNPIELLASGRDTGGIWVNKGEAYKFILTDSIGGVIDTIDNVVVGEVETTDTRQLLISMTYCATPGAQGFMGGAEILLSATLPVDFDGASGSVQTNPASSYVISVKLNGTVVGTITISTLGVFTFATTGGAEVDLIFGDTLTFYAPDTVGTAANFSISLLADLA